MATAVDFADFFECSICLETFTNPKQLECYHHYCKICLDGILKFQSDGSATIDCPRRCSEQTCIGEKQTTNNRRVSYEFKGAMESVSMLKKNVEARCQYKSNCDKDIVLYCCGIFMCQQCSVNHETSQEQHQEKTCVYFDEKKNKVNVLCQEHLTGCTHLCSDDDEFLCIYCLSRSHKNHKKYTIKEQSSFVKQVLISHSEKLKNVMESRKLTEKEMLENKKKLDKSLKERKIACLCSYIDFLNEEENAIQQKFQNVYMEHTREYPSPNSPDYYENNLLKEDIQLVIERVSIADNLAKTNVINSNLRNVTLTLNEEFNFRDMHPLGELQVEYSEDVVSFSQPPPTTFKTIIGVVNRYENILSKFNEQLNELLKESDEAIRVSKSMDVKLKMPSPKEVACSIKNGEPIKSSISPDNKPTSKPDISLVPKMCICITKLEEGGIKYIEELIRGKENDTLKLLLTERPAIVKLRSPHDGHTPFLMAAQHNNADMLQAFLEHGVSAELRGIGKVTALHVAALHDSVECVEWLLKHQPELINTTTDFGNTPLNLAAVKGNIASLKLLLKYGADAEITNNNNKTPLASARTVKGNKKCIKHLKKALFVL